jgi:uncharacterized protein (TIGR02145 family)
MNKLKFISLTAALVLAITFTFSCSDSGGGGGGNSNCIADFGGVTIGSQVWAKKNLNCDVGVSKCYDNDPANCTKYGRLYDWNTAKTACPKGWHLPSDAEWDALMTAVGGSSTAGEKLKATSGWNSDGNGTDEYGFSALPGGGGSSDGYFFDVGSFGHWWSATEYGSDGAYYRLMDYYSSLVRRDDDSKSSLFSVRCVQD